MEVDGSDDFPFQKKVIFRFQLLIFRGDGVFVLTPKKRTTVGGGNSPFFYVHPDPWGFMIQFDDRPRIFLENGLVQPPPREGEFFVVVSDTPPVGEIFYFLEVSARR